MRILTSTRCRASFSDHEPRRRFVGLSFFLLLLSAAPVFAQTGTIAGRIVGSDNGRPIAGALVEARNVRHGSRTVLTNHDGAFRIVGLESANYVISVAAIGYGTQTADTVHVAADGTATLSITLQPRPIELNALVVTSSRKAEKSLEAPAHVEIVGEREIESRPALTLVDHLRAMPAVDVVTGGLQSSRVVVRGFNSSFSGSLHIMTDNRIAGMPSLRVNFLSFVPQTNEDIERVEVLLGPGAALYGPNTANGVLHMITKSPIDDPGSTVSVTGGERSLLHVTGRTAIRLSDRFGFKISGQYFRGHEWPYVDPREEGVRQLVQHNFDLFKLLQPPGLSEAELHRRADRIGARDFDVARHSLDARADWRPTPDLSAILTAGRTNLSKGIEIAGVGAGMIDDWSYGYYQARLNYRRWFAQGYVTTGDAGNTFALMSGAPIVDRSKVWVGQIQHSANWRNLDFTYGGDLIRTQPVTGGTIHGSHEDSDNYTEYGGYAQAKAALSANFDLLMAGRWDRHTALRKPVFSPRAALVAKPSTNQTFRLTYNRAFSTPSSIELFIDMDGGPDETFRPLGYRVWRHGSAKEGIDLADSNGWPLGMRVPGQAGLVAVTAGHVYDAQLKLLIASLQMDPATAALAPLLQQRGPAWKAGAEQLPVLAYSTRTKEYSQVEGSVSDVPGIEPSISTVWEVGYKGLLGESFLLSADAWRSKVTDFIASVPVTPLYFLGLEQFETYLTQNAAPELVSALVQAGKPDSAAQRLARSVIATWVNIPGGVASSEHLAAGGASVLKTHVNLGDVRVWGFDLSLKWWASKSWSASGTYSHVSDDSFCVTDPRSSICTPLALNAPKDKITASLAYSGTRNGLSGEVRVRHAGEFPVYSSVYKGMQCIDGGGEPCVQANTLFDFMLGHDLSSMRGASVQLAITNVFNEPYRSFVGVPTVGRLALLRLRYEF